MLFCAMGASPLVGQESRVRVDFEGSAARPTTPAAPAYTPGPRARIDFEGRHARASGTGTPAYVAGPRLRIDFEGRGSPTGPVASGAGDKPAEKPPAGGSKPSVIPVPPVNPGPRLPVRAPVALPAQAAIEGIEPATCVLRGGAVTLTGRGFGSSQGERQVVLLGKPAIPLAVRSWSDARVIGTVPNSVTAGMSYGVGLQDLKGNGISNTDRRLTICR
jgi:hypothetical protein